MKKSSISHPIKSFGYIKCQSLSSPKPIKSLAILSDATCQKVCSWSGEPEIILEIRKEATFLEVINKPILCKFFKDFTNHKKKTNLSPNILKCSNHRWGLRIIWKTRLNRYGKQTGVDEFRRYSRFTFIEKLLAIRQSHVRQVPEKWYVM